jgi:hypothetical protein
MLSVAQFLQIIPSCFRLFVLCCCNCTFNCLLFYCSFIGLGLAKVVDTSRQSKSLVYRPGSSRPLDPGCLHPPSCFLHSSSQCERVGIAVTNTFCKLTLCHCLCLKSHLNRYFFALASPKNRGHSSIRRKGNKGIRSINSDRDPLLNLKS